MKRAVLILAGGAGTRLWPLSTDDHPKQFLRIFGGRSLLERTFDRLSKVVPAEQIFISTNERYRAAVAEQLSLVSQERILVEPARRNTAPAIAICTEMIRSQMGDSVIGVFPSDHSVGQQEAFVTAVERAMQYAETHDAIGTIGLDPSEPNTGFGYLELGDAAAAGVVRVRRFVEKPDLERAKEFVASGRHVWNGGMFVYRASVFAALLEKMAPEVASLAQRYVASSAEERSAVYERMPSISIDYAVMEKAPDVVTVRGDFDWSDVGSWSAVASLTKSFASGRLITKESDAFVHSTSGRPVVVVGASDLVIVETERGILVIRKGDSEKLSAIVKEL